MGAEDEVDAAMKGPNAPKFLKGENLIFDKVSIYKPDGTLLCKNLNFTIKAGDRILVTGAIMDNGPDDESIDDGEAGLVKEPDMDVF